MKTLICAIKFFIIKNSVETRPLGVIKLEFEFLSLEGEFAQVGPNVKFSHLSEFGAKI